MKLLEKFKKYEKEIIRFLIVGALATLLDYLVTGLVEYICYPDEFKNFMSLFTIDTLPEWCVILANSCGFIAGLLFNYILSIIFVYDNKGNSKTINGFIVFTILSLIGLLISNVGVYIGYDLLKINQWVCKIVMTIIVMIYNYISKRIVIFKEKGVRNDGQD